MILKTQRLVLRPWQENDAENLYQYAKDPAVGPMAGWPVHTSVENSRQILLNVLMVPETYAVVLQDSGQPVGSIGLLVGQNSNLGIPDTEGEVGYWIGVPHWGHGYIPEATREIIRHGFEDLQLDCLWCGYFDGNEKSRRVGEKCGFTYHRTEYNKPWPLIDAVKTQHVTRLRKEDWQPAL